MSNGSASPPAYLPACWSDDEIMRGHMALIKARSVNSIDHDRKIRFWTECIASLCKAERNAVFNLEYLKRKFRRGDHIPAGLATVIESLQEKGELISLDEWREKHTSWVGWGASKLTKTSSWLFGSSPSIQNLRFIHLPTIQNQAEELLKLYLDELKAELDCAGEVISFDDLYQKAHHIINTKENFDIILEYMTDNGDVTVGFARNGEKIVKFKDSTSDSPVRFTEADASVHDIRRAMNKVEKEISALEIKVKKLDEDTRRMVRSGDKKRAAMFLRQKKQVEKNISEKDGQLQGLLSMLHQLSSSKMNKEVIDAYKIGAKAFKDNLSRHGLSPDKVDETMDEIQGSIDDFKEVEQALSQGFGLRNKEQEEDLENELNELLKESKAPVSPTVAFPEVPAGTFGIREEPMDDDDSTVLERRLQKLREMSS